MPPEIPNTAGVLWVTVFDAEAVQPLAAVTVTVKVAVAVIVGEILCVVAPVLQRKLAPAEAVMVAVVPGQAAVAPVIEAVAVFTVTSCDAVAVQPDALVTVTE